MDNLRKLNKKWKSGFFLCVGLDTDIELIPKHLLKENGDAFLAMISFNKEIVDATKDSVCAFKINSAFYEKYGIEGMRVMEETIKYIKRKAPNVFLIADAKRGDIGNTNEGYKYFLKDSHKKGKEWSLGFDAMTIHGYLGLDANETFIKEKDKFFFVLCKTSNKGSGEFQDLLSEGYPLYLHTAKNIKEKWNKNKNCGLVLGATHGEHILKTRSIAGEDIIFLVPGIGAQGGDLKEVIQCGMNNKKEGLIINMSRSVIYASKGKDFAKKARAEVEKFNQKVEKYLKLPRKTWQEEKKKIFRKRILEILGETKAVIMDGHFVYQTGRHGNAYVAKDRITPVPLLIDEVGMMLADLVKDKTIDTVVAPAVGGIVLGHTVGKYLSFYKQKTINSIFLEKGEKGKDGTDTFRITRGYDAFLKGKNVLVVEDIVNTGHSVKEVIKSVERFGGKVKAITVICNRGKVKEKEFKKIKLFSLVDLNLKTFKSNKCPLCKKGIPINTDFGHGSKAKTN
ncbi:MAG: orotidine-5'-phosphate decarboxylase [Candidatus Paceibacterota bacterium]